MKPATSNLACSGGLPRPIIKLHPKEKFGAAMGWGAPQNLGFPFNISATTEDSDLKFNMLLGFTKAHHKITPRGKVDVALG